jgi:M6 family metalloprotease-like protein
LYHYKKLNTMKNSILQKISLIVIWLSLSVISFGRPYHGEIFSLKQPDGTLVETKVFGNEFYQDVESFDGYTLIRDEVTNEICYALLSSDGDEYASSGIRYTGGETPEAVKRIVNPGIRISEKSIKKKQEETKRELNFDKKPEVSLRAARVLPDTVYGIVVLVDFPDVKSSITREQVINFCNGDNYKEFGNYQSIKEYFQWISNGKLTYLNYVTDFYTAPHNKSYYDSGDGYKDELFMPVVEAALNEERTVKLSNLTSLSGRLLAINIFYAGTADAGWAKGLWPHMGWFNFRLNGFRSNTWHTFQMSDLGNRLTIGTFIHENGHLVCGWPDFYSYDGHNDNNDKYNMGAGNSRNPGVPSPWCLDQMGWLDKINITDITDGRTISLTHRVGEAAVYYGTKNNAAPEERYYIELRKSTVEHPEPHDGIFIWHTNENGDNTTAGKPELQDCRPATIQDPCFKQGNATIFNDDTDPSGIWYNGNRSGINLWDFSAVGSTMTFRCGTLLELPEINTGDMAPVLLGIAVQETLTAIGGTAPYSFMLSEGFLPDGLVLSPDGIISGIPEITGDFSFSVTVTDAGLRTNSKRFTLTVINSTPYNRLIDIPGIVEFENFDDGGEGIAYHDTNPENSGNNYRRDEGVDIYYITGGGYGVGWTQAGEWLQYSVDVKETGIYSVQVYHTGPYSDVRVDLLIDNVLVASNIELPYTGRWGTSGTDAYRATAVNNISLTEGEHKLRFFLQSCSGIDLDKMVFSLESAVDVNTAGKNSVWVFSNKLTGEFDMINGCMVENISVYNVGGILIEHICPSGDNISFGNSYPSGIYLIKVLTTDGYQVFKVNK